jgi:2,5-diketo-D-gluconate reductase B
MRYETVGDLKLPKIGLGTWSMGGNSFPNPFLDVRSLHALRSALDLGYTHFDTAERYAAGRAEELLGRAVRESGAGREKLFITTKISPVHLSYNQVLASCAGSLRRLGMDYVDLYLIHWPVLGMKLEEAFPALNRLVHEGKVRHLGVSNFNLKLLQQSAALSESPLLTDQVSFSLPDRTPIKEGVLEYCQAHDILVTAYTPLKHRANKSNPVLKEVAQERGLSSAQVALAWLTTQPRVIAIPMSFNPQHLQENFAAGDVVLTDEEILRLTKTRD